MSRPVVVRPQTAIAEVERILEKNRFNALPVVDAQEQLLGVVTTVDLLKAFASSDDSILPPYNDIMRRPVAAVMSQGPVTVPPCQPLPRLLEKMIETRTKSFPIVEDGHLVGVVTREDVMRALRRADEGRAPEDRTGQATGLGTGVQPKS